LSLGDNADPDAKFRQLYTPESFLVAIPSNLLRVSQSISDDPATPQQLYRVRAFIGDGDVAEK
jgi:hypothetical protein